MQIPPSRGGANESALPFPFPMGVGDSTSSQMDCIDLTANITELLLVLDRNKPLKLHRVDEPVSRGLIVDGN
jgi:hypothetical protein